MKSRERRVQLVDVVRELPRRKHDLPRRTVRASQRWRLIEAVTEVVARVGYNEMTVAEVIAVASVSRKTFYEHFRDKEDCFLAAYEFISDRLIGDLVALGRYHRAGAARRRAQVTGFLVALSREPLAARAFMIDVLGAGPRALARRESVNERFGEAILGSSVDGALAKAIVGGVNAVSAGTLLEQRAGELPALADRMVRFVEAALAAAKRRR